MYNYKPIFNSSLLQESNESSQKFQADFSNYSLKAGAITEVYAPSDEKNQNKLVHEYNVVVIEQKDNGGQPYAIYKNCVAMGSFGSLADFSEQRLRKPSNDNIIKDLSTDKYDGSLVLLLCLGGQGHKAIIIGSINHPNKQLSDPKDLLNLEGEYNGINWRVNNDGELKITWKSKTDNKGKPEQDGNTFIQLNKEGSIELSDSKNSIKIDKPSNSILFQCGKEFQVKSDSIAITSNKAKVSLSELLLECQGQASCTSQGPLKLTTNNLFKVEAQMMEISTKAMLKIKSQLIQVDAPLIKLGTAAKPAVILNTQFLGIGNLGAPVISTAIGPFSVKVMVE